MHEKIEVFAPGALPESLAWQSLSFMRCEWPWLFRGDGRLRSSPFPAADHVTCTDEGVLLSYAETVDAIAVRAGRQIRVAGLSNVFTFPPYRHEGLASEIVRTANSLIDGRGLEMAILFCEEDLVPFYSALGWIAAPAGAVTTGGDVPRAMVRRAASDGADLIAGLRREPIAVGAPW